MFGWTQLSKPSSTAKCRPCLMQTSRRFAARPPRIYTPSLLDNVEDAEHYHPGGLHPIFIGAVLGNGRYRVVHKLGFGGSSTVWLARDLHPSRSKLVTLKVLRADCSSTPEVSISKHLNSTLPVVAPLQFIDDCFTESGPNGSHVCLVSSLMGLSVRDMLDCPGRTSGSRRLRKELAQKVAKQTAAAVHLMHSEGVVHGDLTTSNILFRLKPHVFEWTDDYLYATLEAPETEKVRTLDDRPPGIHAPAVLVAPVSNSKLNRSTILEENAAVTDFGQSYLVASPPPGYRPGIPNSYMSPEARFEGRFGFESDIWALACTIFEIRAGFPLFESFLGGDEDILRQTVETLGPLPDPWRSSFKQRCVRFDESGQLQSLVGPIRAGSHSPSVKDSISQVIRSIGEVSDDSEDSPIVVDDPMLEQQDIVPDEAEIEALSDLLERMLRYHPEERIQADEVLSHSWFTT